MHANAGKTVSFVSMIILTGLAILCLPSHAVSSAQVTTDKDIYNYGEPIKVTYANAPGVDRDWICVVPAGSPDTEGGDYQNIPGGVSRGVLTFAAPAPGKYEVRAYYNYAAQGYIVSARHAFSVAGGPDYEKAQALALAKMERPVDPGRPEESGLRAGEGLVYIFREAAYAANAVEAEILANGKSITVLPHSSYFLSPVVAGDINFTTGSLTTLNLQQNKKEEVWTMQSGAAAIKVKAGYVYYLRVGLSYRGGYAASLEQVPHREGADLIANYKFTLHK